MSPSAGRGAGRSSARDRLTRLTLPEAVLNELRRFMIEGRLGPGDPIRVDQVASELSVSAIPVREALRVLLAEHRVEYLPHRGYRVTSLSFEEVEELFLMCRLLEGEGIRRGVPQMNVAADRRMLGLLAALEEGPTQTRLWERISIHQDLHFVPIESANLPRLEAELRRLWNHTDHYRSLTFFSDQRFYTEMNLDHRRFTEACMARDPGMAVEMMDTHRDRALVHMREAMRAA